MKKIIFLFCLFILIHFQGIAQLNIPQLTAPLDSSFGNSMATFINWTSITGASNYELKLSTNPTLLNASLITSTTSNFTCSALNFGATYYWQVRALKTSLPLDSSAWSQIFRFTVIDSVYQTAPLNGSTNISPSVLLNWSTIKGNLYYEIEIDKTSTFNSSYLVTLTSPDSVSEIAPLNLDFNTTYFWKVRAIQPTDTSVWSQTWTFTTLSKLSLVAPLNGAINLPPVVFLDWDFVTRPMIYDVERDTSLLFNSPLHRLATNDTSSSFTTAELLFGTKYYWRARAHNAVDTSQWSAVFSFTTMDTINRISPLNGTTNVSTKVTLNWSLVTANTESYQVELDSSPLFNSPNLINAVLFNSNFPLTALKYGTKYFWRIRVRTAIDTSLWTPVWNFTTLSSPSLTSPLNASINQFPRSTLNWISVGNGSLYEIQYDTTFSFNSPVKFDTIKSISDYTASNLFFNTKYFWRVRTWNTIDTSSWSTVWNFTTMNQLTPVAPLNGAVTLPFHTIIDWSSAAGVSAYIYRFDTLPDFSTASYGSVNASSQSFITLAQYGQTYYWQVRAVDLVDTSAWSAPWAFTTLYQLNSTPMLASPLDSSVGIVWPAALNWNSVSGINGYEVQYSLDSIFSAAFSAFTSDTSSTTLLLHGLNTYYWHVRVYNLNGYSPWSQTWSFTTYNPFTAVPQLASPSDSAANVSSHAELIWNNLNFADSYQIQWSSDSLYGNAVIVDINDTTYITSLLLPLNSYYWHVRGKNGNAYSGWSATWTFTTENPLVNAPVLISPADQNLNSLIPAQFEWHTIPFAVSYECEYDTSAMFTSPVILYTNDTAITSLPLNAYTKYFWKIRAIDGPAYSLWSSTWSFTTTNLLRFSPNLIAPANQAGNVSIPVIFSWHAAPEAIEYHLEYATDSLFSSSSLINTTDTNSSALLLNGLSTYYWRVKAVAGILESAWSVTWDFTTENPLTDAPIQIFPANGDSGITIPVTFTYASIAFASSYEIEYGTDSLFSTSVIINSNSDTAQSGILQSFTNYFWRVRGKNGSLYSPWSSPWLFKTAYPLSLDFVGSDKGLLVYPNPSRDKVIVKLSKAENEAIEVQLYSSTSELILDKKNVFNSTEINVSELNAGIYFICIKNAHAVFYRKLVVGK